MFNKPQPKGGDPLSASWLADLWREVTRLGKIKVVAPLKINNDAAGMVISVDIWAMIWIQVTAVGVGADVGKYAWKRVIPVAGGGWEDAPDGKTGSVASDPASEVNSSGSFAVGFRARAWRDPVSLSLLF